MNPTLMAGTFVVTMALISYSFAILKEQKHRALNLTVSTFLTLGVLLDITATILMILGSKNKGLTVHGIIGYTALAGMLIDTILIWKLKLKVGDLAPVPKNLHLYTRFAYAWWMIAFFTGGLIASFLK